MCQVSWQPGCDVEVQAAREVVQWPAHRESAETQVNGDDFATFERQRPFKPMPMPRARAAARSGRRQGSLYKGGAPKARGEHSRASPWPQPGPGRSPSTTGESKTQRRFSDLSVQKTPLCECVALPVGQAWGRLAGWTWTCATALVSHEGLETLSLSVGKSLSSRGSAFTAQRQGPVGFS